MQVTEVSIWNPQPSQCTLSELAEVGRRDRYNDELSNSTEKTIAKLPILCRFSSLSRVVEDENVSY